MRAVVRTASYRAALIAVGPRAARLVEVEHEDLELVDTLVIDAPLTREVLAWLAVWDLEQRPFLVFLFDAWDEAFWATAAAMVRVARAQTSGPVWFVCRDSREPRPRRPMLARLAKELDTCVIDPNGCDALSVALMAIAGLWRLGVTGFDIADVTAMAPPGTVGIARSADDERIDPQVDRALVVMRCSDTVRLQAISEVCDRLATQLPSADLLIATPTRTPQGLDDSAELCVVVFEGPSVN